MLRFGFILALLALATGACDGAAQRQPESSASRQAGPGGISGQAGDKVFEASGPADCKHAPTASIYGVPAALWMVEYSNPDDPRLKQLNMTLWRPKDGSAEQLSLSVSTGSGSHRIQTGGRGGQVGSGSVTLSQSGSGGRFEIKGTDGTGTRIEITVACPSFGGIEAEGG